MNIPIAVKLISLSLFAIPGTAVFGSTDLNVFVTSSNGNVRLDMKATETTEVADFTVKPESVVQITQGDNLVVFTQPADNVEKVKVTDTSGVRTEPIDLGNNQYSLIGYPTGVYVLDVIVDLPDSDESGAFETILVILKPGEQPQNVQTIIQKVKVVTEVDIDFDDDDSDKCSDKLGSAGLRFPFNKKSECQYEEWQDCKDDALKGIKWDDRCKDINHGFEDDCEGFANKKECDEHWNTPPVVPPYCDENTPVGTVCRDEGEEVDFPKGPIFCLEGTDCPKLPEVPVEDPAVYEEPIIPEEPTVDTGETDEIDGEGIVEDEEAVEETEATDTNRRRIRQ